MKIKRIEHIAIATKSMQSLKDVFEKKLGIAMEYEEHLPEHATSLAMFPIGETYVELLQSDKPDTMTNRWIAERGEGLFHI
jgi:methylmalonyl-CoA/ethylmalonyl-CoA epimerase